MENNSKLDKLIQDYLDRYCDANGYLPKEKRAGFLLELVRMIQFDASFEENLLKNTTDYIEQHYPNIDLWEQHAGELPAIKTVTEQQFDEQVEELEKNFSHERVDWLKQAGQKLYGKKTELAKEPPKQEKVERKVLPGESERQQSQQSHQRAAASAGKQASHRQADNSKGILGIIVIAVVAVIIYLLSD